MTSPGTPPPRRVPHEITVAADLASVWHMVTTSEGLAAWYGAAASIEGTHVGARVEVSWGDVAMEGRIEACEPPRRLVITYVDPSGAPTGGEEWLFDHHPHDDAASRGVTHVRLIHSLPDPGVTDWDDYYGDYRRGWRLFLTSLRFALEQAAVPHRTAAVRFVPVPSRQHSWEHAISALGVPAPLAAGDRVDTGVLPGARALLVDRPHTLLLADRQRSIAVDAEGAGDDLMLFVQAATHGVAPQEGADFRARVLRRFG